MAKSEQDSIGVLEVLIIFGFTSFFAWYFLMIIGFPAFFPGNVDIIAKRVVQGLFFAGTIAGAFFALHKPKDYEQTAYDPKKTFGWAIVSCLIPVLVMFGSFEMYLPVAVPGILMGASGFGAGYFMTGWENLCSRDRISDELVAMGLSMAIAMGIFLVVSLFMMPLAQGVMGIVIALVGAVLFYSVSKRRDEMPQAGFSQKKGARQEVVEEIDDEELRSTFSMKLSLLQLVVNVPLGFGLAMLYLYETMYFFIAIGVALIALLLFVLIMRAGKVELTFVSLLRLSAGAAVIALLLMGVVHGLSLACSIILFATWLTLRVAHAVIVLKLTTVQKIPPVYLAVRSKLPGYIGFLLGFIASVAVIALTDGRPALAIAGLVIVGVIVVACLTLFPYSEDYDRQLAVIPVVVDTSKSSPEDIEHAKCAELAKRFSLSPREEEILFYIVRGRNAKFIAEKLVISESTAKTHIHNIYKKSGIHSQQKFIDIMDEFN